MTSYQTPANPSKEGRIKIIKDYQILTDFVHYPHKKIKACSAETIRYIHLRHLCLRHTTVNVMERFCRFAQSCIHILKVHTQADFQTVDGKRSPIPVDPVG